MYVVHNSTFLPSIDINIWHRVIPCLVCVCGPYCQSGHLAYLGWAGLWKFRIPAHDHLCAVDKESVSAEQGSSRLREMRHYHISCIRRTACAIVHVYVLNEEREYSIFVEYSLEKQLIFSIFGEGRGIESLNFYFLLVSGDIYAEATKLPSYCILYIYVVLLLCPIKMG